MVAALTPPSPWPTSPAALANAVARLKAAVAPELADARVVALGCAASALIESYAPGAPQPLRDIAVERAAGWLHEQPAASRRSGSIGDVSSSYAPSLTGALLHSGVKSLLYPFRAKRAGVAK